MGNDFLDEFSQRHEFFDERADAAQLNEAKFFLRLAAARYLGLSEVYLARHTMDVPCDATCGCVVQLAKKLISRLDTAG